MKTLLQINSVVNTGSTGRIAEGIGNIAISKGWNSYIAYGRSKRPSESKLIKIGSDLDIKSHVVETRLFDNHGFASRKSTLKFIENIKQINPTVIHLHNLHGYYINVEILFNYLANAKTPVVWTLHDCWAFTGHCSYFSYIKCERWKTHCHTCPLKKSYPASYLVDNSRNNYTKKRELFNSVKDMTMVPVSNWLGSIVGESFINNYPIKVINNGVDLDVFKPIDTQLITNKYHTQNKFIMLGVATSWGERKGLKDYIHLSRFLKEDEVIILVGLHREQIGVLPSNIIGIERTENIKELVELYNLADIVLNLSYEETFGMTTVEGFACGTPSIVYNATASPELITPEVGRVVQAGNIDQLLDAISRIKSRGKSCYFDACVTRASIMYDKEDRFEEYFELYESLER